MNTIVNTCTTASSHTADMDFDAFVTEMRERLQEEYPDCEARVLHADKNNDIHKTGIAILSKDRATAPNIYMEQYYEAYRNGRPMEKIVSDAVRLHERLMLDEEDIVLPDIRDFNVVKDLVCCRLVNRARNSSRLTAMPHRLFLDLAVTYYIPVDVAGPCDGNIAVTDSHFGLWQVDEETLYRHAVENTARLCPVSLQSMDDFIEELCGDREAGLKEPSGKADSLPPIPLYILRCGDGECAGAAALLYAPVLEEFATKHGSFYILPSSIFEVLLLPGGPDPADAADVCRMVRAVNGTQLSPEEVLSDNAYFYHADTGEIEILS